MKKTVEEEKLHSVGNLKRLLKSGLFVLFWILVWEIAARVIDNEILLVTPEEAFKVMVGFVDSLQFWTTILFSLCRIGGGLLLGVACGVILALCSHRIVFVEELLKPVMNLLKTVPVVSFVVLLLIWWGPGFLSVCICFLIVFPNIYIGLLQGLKNVSPQLLQMAKVFRLPQRTTFYYIYRPAVKPFLQSSLSLALGMCWKSGVAAEVIGTPAFSIGEQLYLSKIYLDTGGLFAWTAVIILLSILFEKICMYLVEKFFDWEPKVTGVCGPGEKENGEVRCEKLTKRYGDTVVLNQLDFGAKEGEVTVIDWPSGAGKTTLFSILAGILKKDGGVVTAPECRAMMFQEDRLCMEYSPVKNLELVLGDEEKSRKLLEELLPADILDHPCSQLSGGQKRRVALIRAMEADSSLILLDEPFTGLDPDTLRHAREYIEKRQKGRTVLIATHQ